MMRRSLTVVARVAGWLIVPLYVAGNCAFYLLRRGAGLGDGTNLLDDVEGTVFNVGFGAFAVVGALLVVKRPTNLIGWIMAAIALMVSIFNAGGAYATYVMLTRGQPDALAVVGAWTANCYWFVMLALALFYLPMLFPDGHLPSRRWLPVAVLAGIAASGFVLPRAFMDTLPLNEAPGYRIDNPIGIEGLGSVENLPLFGVLVNGLLVIAFIGAAASVVVRFHRSRGVERQQMKWFVYVTVVLVGGSILTSVIGVATGLRWLEQFSFVLSMVALVGLPITVGIAIFRYRLYEIDVVINRTLVYGPLTALLVLFYLAGVVSLQYVLPGPHRTGITDRHRRLHPPDRSSVHTSPSPYSILHRPQLLPQEVRREEDPGSLLCEAQRQDGSGGTQQRTGGRGKGDDAACPRVAVVASRPTTEEKRRTGVIVS
jgi:hypothetical protein